MKSSSSNLLDERNRIVSKYAQVAEAIYSPAEASRVIQQFQTSTLDSDLEKERRLRAISFGQPVSADNQLRKNANLKVPRDLVGRYLGAGVDSDAPGIKDLMRSKSFRQVDPEIANLLNSRLRAQQADMLATPQRWNADSNAATLGLFGYYTPLPQQSDITATDATLTDLMRRMAPPLWYSPDLAFSITTEAGDLVEERYLPDESALISAVKWTDGNEHLYLPGEAEALLMLARGYGAGLALVKNPATRNGYVAPGSSAWASALSKFYRTIRRRRNRTRGRLNKEEQRAIVLYHHMFAQAAVYGLGSVFRSHGYTVGVASANDPQTHSQFFYIRTSPAVDSPQEGEAIYLDGDLLFEALADESFLLALQEYHKTFLRDPDKQRLGRLGAALQYLRHSDKLLSLDPRVRQDPQSIGEAIIQYFSQHGTIRGAPFRWKTKYARAQDRAGISYRRPRGRDGKPLRRNASDDEEGYCPVYASGPGITGNWQDYSSFGYQLYPTTRTRRSHSRRSPGKVLGHSRYCGTTKNVFINPDDRRRSATRVDTRRGADSQDTFSEEIRRIHSQLPGGVQQLNDLRAEWLRDPQKFGTNPFLVNPATGYQGRLQLSRVDLPADVQDLPRASQLYRTDRNLSSLRNLVSASIPQ